MLNRMVGLSLTEKVWLEQNGRKCGSEARRALPTGLWDGCGARSRPGKEASVSESPTHINNPWAAKYGQTAQGLSPNPHNSRSSCVLSLFNRGGTGTERLSNLPMVT